MKKLKSGNRKPLKNKNNMKSKYWVTLIAYCFSYWALVFGAAVIVIPPLGQFFLIYNWDIQGIGFIFLVTLFIIISSSSIFFKIANMIDAKSTCLIIVSMILMTSLIFLSMFPITKIVTNDYAQAKKLEYQINKIFCDRYPEECLSNK